MAPRKSKRAGRQSRFRLSDDPVTQANYYVTDRLINPQRNAYRMVGSDRANRRQVIIEEQAQRLTTIDEYRTEAANLQLQFEDMTRANNNMTADNQTRRGSLNEQLLEANRQRTAAEQALAPLRQQLTNAQAQMATARDEINAARAQINDLEQELETASQQLDNRHHRPDNRQQQEQQQEQQQQQQANTSLEDHRNTHVCRLKKVEKKRKEKAKKDDEKRKREVERHANEVLENAPEADRPRPRAPRAASAPAAPAPAAPAPTPAPAAPAAQTQQDLGIARNRAGRGTRATFRGSYKISGR